MKLNLATTLFEASSCYHDSIPPIARQVLIASGPLLLTITLGFTSGYSAILLPRLQHDESPITIDQDQASWIASMAALPMAFGCILGGITMEKFGRKTAHLLSIPPYLAGWLTIALATNTTALLIGRFLTGLCGGLLGPITGVYIAETTEPKYRGLLLAAISFAVALGLFLVHLIGTFIQWQATAFIACSLPLIAGILLICSPESPSWLAKQQRLEEAQSVFYWCRGNTDEAKKEYAAMVTRQNEVSAKLKSLFTGEFLKPLVIIIIFIVTNQWAGVNAITFYTVTIMQKILGDGLNEYLAMLIVDVIRVAMAILACIIMKKTGRRPLALISGIGTCLSLYTLSIHTKFGDSYENYPIVPMVALITYISFITIGFVPLPWAMMGEVFPLENRNIGSSISSFMAFIAFFSVVKTGPMMLEHLGPDGTFCIYATIALLGTIFIYFFLPETRNQTLHQIEDQFKA